MEPPNYYEIKTVDLSKTNYIFELTDNKLNMNYFKLNGFKINQINEFEFSKCNIQFMTGDIIFQDIPISLLKSMLNVKETNTEIFINFPFNFFFNDEIYCTLSKYSVYKIRIYIDNKTLDFPITMYYSIGNSHDKIDWTLLQDRSINSNFKYLLDSRNQHILNNQIEINQTSRIAGFIVESKTKISSINLRIIYDDDLIEEKNIYLDDYILENFYNDFNTNRHTIYIDFNLKENNIIKIMNYNNTDIIPFNKKIIVTVNDSKDIDAIVYPIYHNTLKYKSQLSCIAYAVD